LKRIASPAHIDAPSRVNGAQITQNNFTASRIDEKPVLLCAASVNIAKGNTTPTALVSSTASLMQENRRVELKSGHCICNYTTAYPRTGGIDRQAVDVEHMK